MSLLFTDWLKNKNKFKENDMNFNHHIDSDSEISFDKDKIESEIFKICMKRFPEDTMNFLNSLSHRGDQEFNSLFKKLDKDTTSYSSNTPTHNPEEEVVPSLADSSGDLNQEN